ncbi:hypothetical protein [Methanobrevibacter sp.]|uniref:hypothetical protein n=1 Tax=Methanobrevibacter sp. TaxID=66852 RepID=UPI0025F76F0B|nr:hypothetical protein [Methanobrevibacter sp.]MBQ6512237.1 hypothetical protein [Methanobrevibacter sp.]
MKCIDIRDIQPHDSISDVYTTSKFIERKGIPIDEFTLGNCHEAIEEAVDDHQLPITQVVMEEAYPTDNGIQSWTTIEGYIIGGSS